MQILEPFIQQRCDSMVDTMLASSSLAEFVGALGHPLPGKTIFRFISFPKEDNKKLKEWTTNRLAFSWGQTNDAEQIDFAGKMLLYWRYCVDFVRMWQSNPANDFTSELLAAQADDPDELSYEEIQSIVYGLSFAGHEIVTNFLSNGLVSLLSDHRQWEEICADAALIHNAAEEIMRYNSPQTSWRRVATQDTELAGYEIPAGTQIFLSLGSANHDEALFDNPETFDIHRDDARANIAFCRGIHFCLGKPLAIIEATISLETLTQRVPSLSLVADQRYDFFPNFTFRGPKELWLTWKA
tara:strand:+ start:1322 stop:2215 length:894 start_codon:yes stop_codon:yes gene_type:complete